MAGIKDKIKIKGARVHNLKNINLELPKNKLVVFTGVSGSGKSSLAFDTIFNEGQRRYIESLSPYARLFLGKAERPDVDDIEGLSPAIAINQKAHGYNPRSIVATLTEIYDYLRVLFARIGRVYCPRCGHVIEKLSPQEIIDLIKKRLNGEKAGYVTILSPVVRGRKGEHYQLLYDFLQKGYEKARINGRLYSLHQRIRLQRFKNHTIEIVMDKLRPDGDLLRLAEAVESALEYSEGLVVALFADEEKLFSSKWNCPNDNFSFGEIEPRLFSFNSPYGACPSCDGLGRSDFFSQETCPSCKGQRLKPEALSVKINNFNISKIISQNPRELYRFFVELEEKLKDKEKIIAKEPLAEIISRLGFLLEVGLDYITLDREASTLSGGEAQRIRLASQIGSKLSGTLYVLDEPTIGLHERDNERLIRTLRELQRAGNTVVVVEHDERIIRESDFLVDLGPGPGRQGGEVVVAGKTASLLDDSKLTELKDTSLTLAYLSKNREIEIPRRRAGVREKLSVVGALANNLKNINVDIPLKKMVCLTGVSGSGKSSLLHDVLYRNIKNNLARKIKKFEKVNKITGLEYLSKVIEIDQSPIGRTPRSNPATYTGVFTPIREFFSRLPAARERGYCLGRFSFNKDGGRCEACEGAGFNLVEMHFLPTISVPCEICRGRRFNRETLEVKYKGKNIADVLNLTVGRG
jgi:excinuclease ABC subunit A